MKHKKIVQLCKSNKNLQLFGIGIDIVQWLGDGKAVYPMFDLPLYSCDSLCRSYDITDKQAESITMEHHGTLPTEYCFDDTDKTERIAARAPISIIYAGTVLVPIQTETGIQCIQEKYLEPFADYKDIEIYKRGTGDGYFAVKNGLILIGIILPYPISEQLANEVRKISDGIDMATANK